MVPTLLGTDNSTKYQKVETTIHHAKQPQLSVRVSMIESLSLYIFVNNKWCTISEEVSRFCSPEVEYLMISCRPHYLPRSFSSIFFVAVHLQSQTDAGTKSALNELYTAISKQEMLIQRWHS